VQLAGGRGLSAKVRVVEITSNDAWIRDCGPTFVIDAKGRRRGVDWTFNAWGGLGGGLYFPWDRDDEVAQKVLEIEGADRYRTSFVLEGGAIHVDGQGTCLTTEECLLNPNRNPGLGRADIEDMLRSYLGVTHGDLAGRGRLPGRNRRPHRRAGVLHESRPRRADLDRRSQGPAIRNFDVDAYQRLKTARDARGRALTIHKIHQPGPLFMTAEEASGVDQRLGSRPRRAGDRLPASYINFYVANRHVVMPFYDKRRDRAAMRTLMRLFPTRKVVGVSTREVLLGGGNIHCITQQVPRTAGPSRA
jgi:agmatine deiminase